MTHPRTDRRRSERRRSDRRNFGRKAQEQIAQTGERGVELAKVGVVIGWILTSFYGLFFIVWCCFAAQFFSTAAHS